MINLIIAFLTFSFSFVRWLKTLFEITIPIKKLLPLYESNFKLYMLLLYGIALWAETLVPMFPTRQINIFIFMSVNWAFVSLQLHDVKYLYLLK